MLPSGVLGGLAVDTRDVELGFHSPGLRLDISPRMNGVVKARKHLGGIRVTNCVPSRAIYVRLYQTIRE